MQSKVFFRQLSAIFIVKYSSYASVDFHLLLNHQGGDTENHLWRQSRNAKPSKPCTGRSIHRQL